MRQIRFYFEEIKAISIGRREIRQVIEDIFSQEGLDWKLINVIFCSDTYLLKLNRQFLKHDFFTDIITFDNSFENIISGELYISLDRVSENAAKFGVKRTEEVRRVIIHGILHLSGYGDHDPVEKREMKEKEDYYLKIFDRGKIS